MAVKATSAPPGGLTPKQKKRKDTWKLMKQNYQLYFFLVPAVVFIVLFMYVPLYGLQIAFKNYRTGDGIWGSAWVGLKWFEKFFSTPRCWEIIRNTLTISVYSLVAGFPIPIILAIILNYVKNLKFKKFAQTVTYMPYFISTVVLVAMMTLFFSPTSAASNVQYSSGINALISSSLSQMMRSATDCTLPALSPLLIFAHKSGEIR